jgi:hypothetical protein
MRHFVFHCLEHALHLIGLSKNHKKVGAVWQKKKLEEGLKVMECMVNFPQRFSSYPIFKSFVLDIIKSSPGIYQNLIVADPFTF